MATYSRTTGLSPEQVIQRAIRFFEIEGIGLELLLKSDDCVRFVGAVGYVQVEIHKELDDTLVELETREWDSPARDFVRTLPRRKRSTGVDLPARGVALAAPTS